MSVYLGRTESPRNLGIGSSTVLNFQLERRNKNSEPMPPLQRLNGERPFARSPTCFEGVGRGTRVSSTPLTRERLSAAAFPCARNRLHVGEENIPRWYSSGARRCSESPVYIHTGGRASVCARACLHGRGGKRVVEGRRVGEQRRAGRGGRVSAAAVALRVSTRLRAFTRAVKATVPRTRLARARHIDLPFPGPLKPATHARV